MKLTQITLLTLFTLLPSLAFCQTTIAINKAEQKTSQYFDSIKDDSSELLAFLENMPKGGDLHNHLAGAIYPEELLEMSKNDNLCFNPLTFTVTPQSNCNSFLIGDLTNHADIYKATIDNWSLRNFHSTTETKQDSFFCNIWQRITASS